MRFERVSGERYTCHSDSGNAYNLTARPVPDEFESAMRCGIPADDPFVEQIPLVWSCDCPAGRHDRDCKHMRGLFRDVFGEGPTEEEHAAAVQRERAAKKALLEEKTKVDQAAVAANERERAAYLAGKAKPECCRMAADLLVGTYYLTKDREVIARFEEQWGFAAYETRIRQLVHGKQIS